MKNKTIKLEFLSLTVDLKINDHGLVISGNVTGDSLKRNCPYCEQPNCYSQCEESDGWN